MIFRGTFGIKVPRMHFNGLVCIVLFETLDGVDTMRNAAAERSTDQKLNILILQTAAVAVILLFAVGIRIFGGEIYMGLSNAYHERFDDITSADEVLKANDRSIPSESEATDSVSTENTAEDYSEEYDAAIDGEITGNIDSNASAPEASAVVGKANSFMWPVNGRVTSRYGNRLHPITGKYAVHNGIDIAAEKGTEIAAAYDGTVTADGYSDSYGYYIIVAHGNNVRTLYAHCSKLLLSEGDTVKKGDILALVGSTGRSTGPHVHFEVRVGSYRVDPEWMLSNVSEV